MTYVTESTTGHPHSVQAMREASVPVLQPHAPVEHCDFASRTSRVDDSHDAHGHPHLAHHYDTPQQQYEAAKLGMWLFIATELLLFGGLFVAYAVYRGNNPELFQYCAQFLSTPMGAMNTVVLLVSSMTIAFALRCAQLNQRRGLIAMLILTLLGGFVFMGIKYIEYSDKFQKDLVWGLAFYDTPTAATTDDTDHVVITDPPAPVHAGDPSVGRALWMQTCFACHGAQGEGVRGQAFALRESGFVSSQNDEQLLAFIKRGRMPFDAANRTGVQMPPRGGNPLLKDEQIKDIIAYIRTLDVSPTASDSQGDEAADDAEQPTVDDSAVESVQADLKPEFHITKSSIPPARIGPAGLADDWEEIAANWPSQKRAKNSSQEFLHPRDDPNRPDNVHVFFGIYFLMTGLHGLHVLIGMAVIGTLVVLSWLGRFSSAYYTPVELTGLYWHVVDVIWIFLFPLLYLLN